MCLALSRFLSATVERNGRRLIVVAMGSSESKIRDIKVKELIERGFAGMSVRTTIKTADAPAASPGAATNTANPATTRPATTDLLPTVKTDKSAVAPAPVPSSTTTEPTVTFRVIPPHKIP